jgi:hypothetical protein
MEAVFALAYCTIAATSAKDSTQGFLTPRSVKQFVRLQDSKDSQLYAYVTFSEDFDRDLEEGELYQRAWVLQERASWSWMVYQGGIRYRTSDLRGLSWEHIQLTTTNNLRLDAQEQYILEAPLGRIVQSLRVEGVEGTNSKIKGSKGRLLG